jgi:hypothetical protein
VRKNIDGFEHYIIDSDGYVISKERYITESGSGKVYKLRERVLKPHKAGKGYLVVNLRKDNKTFGFYIHRLVAESFIENPNNFKVVNHIDGNKENNSIKNLEWCSYSANNQHAYDTGLRGRGSNHYKSKLTEEDVIEIKHLYFYENVKRSEIYKLFPNVHRATIHDVLSGKTWKHITNY